jgi:hypothetical protein
LSLLSNRSADSLDRRAPQVVPLVAVAWDGEAARFDYSVGTESKSDPVSSLAVASSHDVRIVIARGGRVSFFVDERLRWTSSLRFLGFSGRQTARIWLGGRATRDSAGIRDVRVHERR